METFRITAVPQDSVCTLILRGEIDLAVAPDLRELGTVALADPDIQTVVLDLHEVTFIDSTAIGSFISLRNTAEESTKHVVLANVPLRARRVLKLMGLDDLFGIEADEH